MNEQKDGLWTDGCTGGMDRPYGSCEATTWYVTVAWNQLVSCHRYSIYFEFDAHIRARSDPCVSPEDTGETTRG